VPGLLAIVAGGHEGHPLPYGYPGFLEIAFAACSGLPKNRKQLAPENKLESLISRESSFLFNNLVLLAACFAVLCGTLFPILSNGRGYKLLWRAFFNKV